MPQKDTNIHEMPIRILIADDHEIFRRGLRSLLESHPEWEVCGEAIDGQEAVDRAKELNPDIVVLDITMPRLNGLRSEEHTSELQSQFHLVCRLLLEKKNQ